MTMRQTSARGIGCLLLALAIGLAGCGGASPEDQLAEAERAYAQGDLRTASITVRNLLQDAPENAEARLLFGQISLDIGDLATAESELSRARELGADEVALGVALAEVLLKKNQATEAQVVLAGIPSDQRTLRADLLDVDALLQLKELDAAERALSPLVAARPDDAEVLVRRAWLAVEQGDFADAAALAEQAQEAAPGLLVAVRMAGEVAQRQGRFGDAAAAFQRSAELAGARGQARDAITGWYAAAVSYLRTRDFESAGAAIDQYEGIVGVGPATQYLRASVRYEQGDYKGADALLREAVLASPDDGNVLRLLGATKLALGDLSAARRNLRAALGQQPGDATASRLLAQVLLRQGQPEAALEELRRLDVTSAANVVVLAQTLVSVGQPEEAIELLEKNAADGRSTRETRLALAGAYAAVDDAAAVERTLRDAVAGDAEDYVAVLGLMQAYIQSGEVQRARELVDSLLAERPDDFRAYASAVVFLQATGDREQALVQAEAAAKRFPELPQSQFILASVAGAAEQWAQAEAAFETILDLDDANVGAMLGLAQVYERTARETAMVAMLERAAAATERDPRPALALGRLQLRDRNYAAAEPWLQQALELAPTRAETHALLGTALLGQNQSAQARQAFEQAVIQDDAAPGHFVMLARMREADGSAGAAGRALDDALARFPDSNRLKLERGRLAIRTNELDVASRYIDDILESAPDNPEALAADGAIALRRMDTGKARRRYEAALENGAGDAAYMGLYQVAVASGEQDPAQMLEQGLQRFPDSVPLQMMLAQRYQGAGDTARASALYRQVLELQPDNAITLNNLAWLLYEAGDDEALALAERAVEIAPDSPPVLDTYGVILLGLERNDEALDALQRASAGAPDSAEIRYHLAQAQAASGDDVGARESLRAVLSVATAGEIADGARELLDSLQ